MVDNETAKTALQFGKDVAEDLVRPTSKSIGSNLGLLVDGVMGWLGYWGQKQAIKREVYLADYKEKITERLRQFPKRNCRSRKFELLGQLSKPVSSILRKNASEKCLQTLSPLPVTLITLAKYILHSQSSSSNYHIWISDCYHFFGRLRHFPAASVMLRVRII